MDETKLNPYDYKDDEARLEALNREIKQAEESLENDFAKFASSKLTDEKSEALFFENKELFIKQILQLQNEFLKDLQGKINEAKDLKERVGEKKALSSIQKAADAFDAKGLEVNSDVLLDFYQNDLTLREKKEFESLKPAAFFEAVYKRFKNGKSEKPNDELPKRLEASGANVENDVGEILTQRF